MVRRAARRALSRRALSIVPNCDQSGAKCGVKCVCEYVVRSSLCESLVCFIMKVATLNIWMSLSVSVSQRKMFTDVHSS